MGARVINVVDVVANDTTCPPIPLLQLQTFCAVRKHRAGWACLCHARTHPRWACSARIYESARPGPAAHERVHAFNRSGRCNDATRYALCRVVSALSIRPARQFSGALLPSVSRV